MKFFGLFITLTLGFLGSTAFAGDGHRHYSLSVGWNDAYYGTNYRQRQCRDNRRFNPHRHHRRSGHYYHSYKRPHRAHYRRDHRGHCFRVEYTRRGEVYIAVPTYRCY